MASKSHGWFKSYGNFAEWVDFCLLVELYCEGVRTACEAGLFLVKVIGGGSVINGAYPV